MVWPCAKKGNQRTNEKSDLIQAERMQIGRGRPKITLVEVIKMTFQLMR